jgi:hypothetical protein
MSAVGGVNWDSGVWDDLSPGDLPMPKGLEKSVKERVGETAAGCTKYYMIVGGISRLTVFFRLLKGMP